MPEKQQNFSQSIKYAMPLIEDKAFKQSVYFLLSRLINKKSIRENHWINKNQYFDKVFTILKNPKYCKKDCENSTKDGKDYRLYNLTLSRVFNLTRKVIAKNGKEYIFTNGITVSFNDKYSCNNFIKDLGIRRKDVIFSAYLPEYNKYTVTFRFNNGITQKQKTTCLNYLNFIFSKSQNRYRGGIADEYCCIPSSIYQRWFDPFDKKVLWNADDIKKSFNNSINYSDLMSKIIVLKYQYTRNRINDNSRIGYFISNSDKVSPQKLKENLYIVNHYINKFNPYIRKEARKDWKYAAEQYLNEILGKISYISNDKYNEDLKYCIEQFINNDSNVKIYLRYAEESRKRLNRIESLSEPLSDTDKADLKIEKENIEIYTNYSNECKNKDIEKAKEYMNSKIDDYSVIYFSKKETEYFVNSLNLKTKICPVKLRKIVLDVIKDLGIINVVEEYRSKVFCRKYKVMKERIDEFYKFIKDKFNSFIFILKYYYMLKNSLCKNTDKNYNLLFLSNINLNLSGPPD